jgi:hypothetical protein
MYKSDRDRKCQQQSSAGTYSIFGKQQLGVDIGFSTDQNKDRLNHLSTPTTATTTPSTQPDVDVGCPTEPYEDRVSDSSVSSSSTTTL